jgi:putative membrane protein
VTELPPVEQPLNPYADRPRDARSDHREWQRLDPLMLLVHPVREVIRFLPALLGLLIAGTASGGHDWWWNVIAIAVPVALGLARYLTTSFRIDAGRVELRRGLLNKHVLSTSIDRVRTVDVTASPIHRLLGLTTVRIGTGTASKLGEDHLDLDGIRAHAADALRADLLRRTRPTDAQQATGADAFPVVQFETGWLRFAPFTSSGLIIAAAVLGGGSQILNGLGLWERLAVDETAERLSRLSLLLVVPIALVGLVVVASVLAVIGYLVTNFGFTLTYTRSDHAWHLRRGLLTTRETSMDATRLRGVSLGEPLGLRLVSGARLSAIVTGLDRDERGSGTLVPPAPRDLVAGVAAQVLGAAEPVTAPLVPHGEAATRRRYVRALTVPALVTVATALLVLAGDAPWETALLGPLAIAVGLVLAADRARTLGHALVAGHLVSRAGSLVRRRVALDTQAVIGWNFADSWFQRRAGLTTLVATMAGGRQSVTVLDVPEGAGVALARDAVPGLVDQFLREDRPPRRVLQVPAEVPESDT